MDWNIIINTAIGTVAGSILTLISGFVIYFKDRKHNIRIEHNKREFEYANHLIRLILESNNVILTISNHYRNYMYGVKNRDNEIIKKSKEIMSEEVGRLKYIHNEFSIYYNIFLKGKFCDEVIETKQKEANTYHKDVLKEINMILSSRRIDNEKEELFNIENLSNKTDNLIYDILNMLK